MYMQVNIDVRMAGVISEILAIEENNILNWQDKLVIEKCEEELEFDDFQTLKYQEYREEEEKFMECCYLTKFKNTTSFYDAHCGVISFNNSKLMILLHEDDERYWGDGFIYKDEKIFNRILEEVRKSDNHLDKIKYKTPDLGSMFVKANILKLCPLTVSFIRRQINNAIG